MSALLVRSRLAAAGAALSLLLASLLVGPVIVSTGFAGRVSAASVDDVGFVSLPPARLLDTRHDLSTADGLFNGVGAVGPGEVLDVVVVGRGGVPPSGVGAVVLNITATAPSAAGFVTVFPSGAVRPTASNLNFVAGQTTPNLTIAKVGAGGMVSLFNSAGSTDLIADVVGWFPPAPTTTTTLDPVRPTATVSYQRFDNGTELLYPWLGRNVALQTPTNDQDPQVMGRILVGLDAAWDYYQASTGRTPYLTRTVQGRDSIAVVTTSCGAACSYLGFTGTEINPQYFATLYNGVRDYGLYDQVQFYEFGRNFWFYGDQLRNNDNGNYSDAVTTGFAVLMRFRSMEAARLPGAPFNGTSFHDFRCTVFGLVDVYESNLSDTWAGTLGSGHSPGAYGTSDFFAAIIQRLADDHGGDAFLTRLWTQAAAAPTATSTPLAIANLVQAASSAASVDLGPLFYNQWGFPGPDGTTLARQPSPPHVPPAGC